MRHIYKRYKYLPGILVAFMVMMSPTVWASGSDAEAMPAGGDSGKPKVWWKAGMPAGGNSSGGGALAGAAYMSADALQIPLRKTRILDLVSPVDKISVGDTSIADIVVLQSRQVQVFGLALGTTNLLFWDRRGNLLRIIDLEVTHDLDTLKAKFHQLLPEQKLQVHSSQGAIVLSGEVSGMAKMDAALALARSFAGEKGEVLNFMQVGGGQQVMLEVQVAEISRTLTKRLGIKFNTIRSGSPWVIGAVNGGAAFPDAVMDYVPIFNPLTGEFMEFAGDQRVPVFNQGTPIGPMIGEFQPNPMSIDNAGVFASFLAGEWLFNMAFEAAKDSGLAKVLAEPTLTTLTGQEASFLAGGEFPIPVPDEDGITIDYKEYGVGLKFLPVVLDSGMINLKVNITVSELNTTHSVALGFQNTSSSLFVPALTKRSAKATVMLGSGQTMGIAGLINENLRENVDKFPGLGDIPVFGALFRSQEFIKGQSELVIFVTPHFAQPIQREQVRLPTDAFVEPNNMEFYLLGRMQGKPLEPPEHENLVGKGGLEGQFGHDLQ